MQTVEAFRHVILERRITLVLEGPTEPLPVYADPKRLRQAICHLLENALKFTETEGTVTITGWREDRTMLLHVRDTGRGIAPEVLPMLFRPFKQIKRSESMEGLGLGLALVKGIVELHGGTVSVTSPGIGYGSTFTIALPVTE